MPESRAASSNSSRHQSAQIGIDIPVTVTYRDIYSECVFLAIGEGERDVILVTGAA